MQSFSREDQFVCIEPHYESEAKCKAFHMKIILFALNLVMKARPNAKIPLNIILFVY